MQPRTTPPQQSGDTRTAKSQSRQRNADSRPTQHLHLAEVVSINAREQSSVVFELERLLHAAENGNIRGISYAATSAKGKHIIGRAGNHRDNDKAIGALFRAGVVLTMVE